MELVDQTEYVLWHQTPSYRLHGEHRRLPPLFLSLPEYRERRPRHDLVRVGNQLGHPVVARVPSLREHLHPRPDRFCRRRPRRLEEGVRRGSEPSVDFGGGIPSVVVVVIGQRLPQHSHVLPFEGGLPLRH